MQAQGGCRGLRLEKPWWGEVLGRAASRLHVSITMICVHLNQLWIAAGLLPGGMLAQG